MDSWRIVILGDGGTGKTELAVQFTLNCYIETYDPEIEDAYRKQFKVDGKETFVEVIDTTGQAEYATLRDQWVREGQGFILVYSIASRPTFERLEVQYQAMLKVKKARPVFMLVGNECEKNWEREVSKEEGAAKAREFGCKFLETSPKTGQNVENLFTDMVRTFRSNKEKAEERAFSNKEKAADDKTYSKKETDSDDASVPPVKPLGSRIKSTISRSFMALRGMGEKDKKHSTLGG